MKYIDQEEIPIINKGEGFHIIDTHGNKYLDGTASMWCNVWGFGRNEVIDAMTDQLNSIAHSTLFGLTNYQSEQLSEILLKLSKGMDKVFYTDNGSTAIEAGLKMAVQYWLIKGRKSKNRFISLENGYHGDTLGAMSVGYVKDFFSPYRSLLKKSFVLEYPKVDLDKSWNKQIENIEHFIIKYKDKCAGLVMESGAQIAGGVNIYKKNFQKTISELCKKHDLLLILDEIATGFGRLGNMIEYLYQESIPDIVCFGKALTGGYFPLAATLTSSKIFEAFYDESYHKVFYHGHTFTGHPVGCAAAIENIRLYKERKLLTKIYKNSKYLESRLNEFQDSPIVSNIRSKGLLAGIELTHNGKKMLMLPNGKRINSLVMKESLSNGVFLRALGNILIFIPSLALDKESLDKIIDVQLIVLRKLESIFGYS